MVKRRSLGQIARAAWNAVDVPHEGRQAAWERAAAAVEREVLARLAATEHEQTKERIHKGPRRTSGKIV